MRVERRLTERIKKINPSLTLAITAKAKILKSEGKDIVNLAGGEPDFDTPDFIKDAAIEAIKTGFTKYTPTTGISELKQSICGKFKKDNSLDYDPGQIVVSCGAKHSIFNSLLVLVGEGDEVLIPSPYWVSYPQMVNICQGIPRFIKTLPENNFKVTVSDLNKYISPKTKLLILNSPANPTGSVYNLNELQEIAQFCVAKKIFVIADEIYEKIIYDNLRHISIASLNKNIYDLTITVNGLSKSYSMTGWRIGYLGAPSDIVSAVSRLQDHSTSNPTSISQKAALAALNTPDAFVENMRGEFQKRRDYIMQRLSQIKSINALAPGGAFYVFCGIAKTGLTSLDFASRLLEEASVAVIPGAGFGRDDYVRISFATSIEQIKKGMDRIEEWLNKL
ncbi:MAG: pyridoxal phosphate-dependent aminotransferase [Candidatus Omnitrophica bacterium]|nr:pyridoxal phosphate-dependent aminotransferase [Candidatus Omnitrophota bacterium]MBU4473315.1 pyridoxal phosphate-dependent aminotransferase [Candidatus Omnitrophota bacterium]MCG2706610.1 pyridoxal phosphate-dependent aminotransferase [Candidatus Omnitrophota bacterium]